MLSERKLFNNLITASWDTRKGDGGLDDHFVTAGLFALVPEQQFDDVVTRAETINKR